MRISVNKIIGLDLSIISIIIFLIIGCGKSIEFEEPIPANNTPYIIHNSEFIDIKATDVYTTSDSLQRKIQIIDRKTSVVYDTFIITLTSIDYRDNLYTQLKNKTFRGSLTIESNGDILLSKVVNKGVFESFHSKENSKIKSNLIPTCKLTVIHNCVVQKIDNMSIFEYGLCLAAAPACYAQLWASCGFIDCIKGEQNRQNV